MCFARLYNRPTERNIRNFITHLETQHSLLNNNRPNRPRPARSEKNIAAVAESVHEDTKWRVDSGPFAATRTDVWNDLVHFTSRS